MKKRYIALLGIMVLCISASGCGNKKSDSQDTSAEISTSQQESSSVDLVEMQPGTQSENISNIIGTKSSTTSELVIINNTGLEIDQLECRATPGEDDDEDDWGSDLIKGAFKLKDKDKALYYYEPKDATKTIDSFDVRITFTDEEESQCMFRELDFSDMKEITLCMQDGIPYATYTSVKTKKPVSTLEDAKKRMGLADEEDEEDSDVTPTPTPEASVTQSQENTTPTPTPGEGSGDNNSNYDSAQAYVGGDLGSLEGTYGNANNSWYEEDTETGGTNGYYQYGDFTVSTSVNEDGSETVIGVW